MANNIRGGSPVIIAHLRPSRPSTWIIRVFPNLTASSSVFPNLGSCMVVVSTEGMRLVRWILSHSQA